MSAVRRGRTGCPRSEEGRQDVRGPVEGGQGASSKLLLVRDLAVLQLLRFDQLAHGFGKVREAQRLLDRDLLACGRKLAVEFLQGAGFARVEVEL